MSTQKKIIHFHPNGDFAKFFVKPLVDAEKGAGHISKIYTSCNSKVVAAIEIPYDLTLKNFFLLPYAFFQIYVILRQEAPDIVVTHNSKSSALVLFSAWCARVPVRLYFNHGVPYIGYSGVIKFILLSLEKINLLLSTKVFSVSLDMVNLLKGVNNSKSINIVHHGSASGIDPIFFSAQNGLQSTFRQENNISENDFLVVFVGRPEKRKGFDLVLKLWLQYFLNAECKLILCGPTEQSVVNFFGFLPNNVIPLGFTAQVPGVLMESDVLILPSLHEGLSYAILESMASKCIVVANHIPGINNLIINEFNGFLVENNRIENYAEIINQIQFGSIGNLEAIRENAFSTARKFAREDFLSAYLLQLHKI